MREQRQPHLVPEFILELPPGDGRALAIFDADGTLWTDDVADDFTTWMIDEGTIPGDRWRTYMRIYRDDPPAGCRYLLSFYTGMSPAALAREVDRWWRDHANRRWIREAVEALHLLAGRGYPIWVVSGTPTDFLLPLKRMLPVDEVVGMDFELDGGGRITGRHAGISCAGEGKAEKLLSVIGGRPVRFCAGNGSLDGPMMRLAEAAWSVYPNPEFARYSEAQGWPILPRPADFVEEEKFLLED
jgi:HAD superfamily phosphoserine phosphatase-like hydrolase